MLNHNNYFETETVFLFLAKNRLKNVISSSEHKCLSTLYEGSLRSSEFQLFACDRVVQNSNISASMS